MKSVSVPLELLERVVAHDFAGDCQECGIGQSEAWKELRALLDKEVDGNSHAPKHQGVPPLIATLHENGELIAAQATIAQQAKLIYLLRAGSQGEPVAVVIDETHNYGRYLVFGAGGSEVQQPRPVVERKAQLFDQTLPIGTKLYAEKSAPVAVVMPERMKFSAKASDYAWAHGDGWNACIEEVAKLNGLKT